MKVIGSAAAVAAVGGVVLSAAVGFASPASAEPPSGNYTATVIDGGGRMKVGGTQSVISPHAVQIARTYKRPRG